MSDQNIYQGPPNWCPNAIASKYGWTHPVTGEVLVRVKGNFLTRPEYLSFLALAPLGPLTASFLSTATANALIATVSGLTAGEVVQTVSPADGRIGISGGQALIVGSTASNVGTSNYTFSTNAGRSFTVAVTVNSASLADFTLSTKLFNPEILLNVTYASIQDVDSTTSTYALSTTSNFLNVSGANITKGKYNLRSAYHNVTITKSKGGLNLSKTFTYKVKRHVQVEDFEDLATGWANATAAPATVEANLTWSVSGKQSLRLKQATGSTGSVRNIKTISASTPIALDPNGYIDFAVNVESAGTSSVAITLTNGAGVASQFTFDNLARGPQRQGAPLSQGTGGTAFLTNNGAATTIAKFQYSVFTTNASLGGAASFDDVRLGPKPVPTIMWDFDDGYLTQLTDHKPVLDGYGWTASLNLQTNLVGTGSGLTIAQLTTLKNAGWVICNHTNTHPDLTTLTPDQVAVEVQQPIDFIQTNNLSTTVISGRACKGSEYHFAYPLGANSDAVDAVLRSKGIVTATTTLPKSISTRNGVLQMLQIPRYGTTSATAATIIANIKSAIDLGKDLIVFSHASSGTPASILQQAADYVKQQQDLGNCIVRNKLEWYESLNQTPLKLPGVNLAGGEFGFRGWGSGGRGTPGTVNSRFDHAYPTTAELDYFAARGVKFIRVPIDDLNFINLDNTENTDAYIWLDSNGVQQSTARTDKATLRSRIQYAATLGLEIHLEQHGYGFKPSNTAKYSPSDTTAAAGLRYQNTTADKTAFQARTKAWVSLFADLPNVTFGIMNEPTSHANAPSPTDWVQIANAGIAGVREVSTARIHVNFWGYTSGAGWVSSGNAAASLGIVDSANNWVREVHQYFDASGAGQEGNALGPVPGWQYLIDFTTHARANGYTGFVGEFAAAVKKTVPADDAAYLNTMRLMLRYMHENRDVWIGCSYWGAGPFWYALNTDGSVRKAFSPEPQNLTDPSVPHLDQMNVLTEFYPIGA